ncbi:chondroitin sulfate synthase 1-like [Branchiostoma floridae x Branchiostoma belcheri]
MAARLVRSKGQLLKSAGLGAGLMLGFLLWVKLTVVSPRSSPWAACQDPDVSDVVGTVKVRHPGGENLVYVGVMTAKKHLDNRVVAAQETWVRDVPGKVEFFSSAESEGAAPKGASVVALKGVTDVYPPMKKSFLMLKYMYDHYVDRFDWFIRADDDVYIKGDRLGRFLRSVDARERPLAVGQAGYGRPEDRAAMRFEPRQNYCMGGTGVLFSRETLRRVGPHIAWCLHNLYSRHDDVELGRCFYNVANVTCSAAHDGQNIFLNNYEGYKEGNIGDFDKPAVRRAITLHPNKLPENQYRFNIHLLSQRMRDTRHRTLVLSREIRHMTELLSEKEISLDDTPQQSARKSLGFLNPNGAESSSSYWEYFKVKKVFKVSGNLTHEMSEEMQAGLHDVITQLTESLNPDRWKTRTSIRGLRSGYRRAVPTRGARYALDLRLRREGVETTERVHLQQAFLTAEFTELDVISRTVSV